MIDPRAASAAIEAANARVAETLPFSDDADFTEAKRGFVAALEPGLVADSGRESPVEQRFLRVP